MDPGGGGERRGEGPEIARACASCSPREGAVELLNAKWGKVEGEGPVGKTREGGRKTARVLGGGRSGAQGRRGGPGCPLSRPVGAQPGEGQPFRTQKSEKVPRDLT